MDLRRLRAGELIAATGGAALFVSLFLPWYRGGGHGPDSTAWEALAVNDVILTLIVAATAALLFVTAVQRVPAVPIAMDSLLTLFGFIGLVLVLVRVAWPPGAADERAWGLWLGLAGGLAIVVGGWIAMRDQRLSPPGRQTDGTGRPAPPPVEIEARPLPSARGPE